MLRKYLLTFGLGLAIFFSLSLSPASAIECNPPRTPAEAAQCGANEGAGVPGSANPGTSIDNTIERIVNLISIIVGIVAVIMVIYAGFRYITSAGNQENIKSAKSTLLYAVIGLVVVALAQIIVAFVLDTATNPPSNTSNTPSGGQGSGSGSGNNPGSGGSSGNPDCNPLIETC